MSELKSYQQRVVIEHEELMTRLVKLRAFFTSEAIDTVSREELVLLAMQLLAMESYEKVLSSRIEIFRRSLG